MLVATLCTSFALNGLTRAAQSAPATPDFVPASEIKESSWREGILNLKTGVVQSIDLDTIDLSPDGKWLVGQRWGDDHIYLRSISDGRTQRMGKLKDVSFFRWEPNSKGFTAYHSAHYESTPTRYKRKRFMLSQPGKSQDLPAAPNSPTRAYSPDGGYYAAPLPGGNSIVIKQTSSGKEIQRFPGGFDKSAWAFNSNRFFFRRLVSEKYQYLSWNAANRSFQTLGSAPQDSGSRYYSPVGNWFLESEGTTRVYLSRPNGTQRTQVVNLNTNLDIYHIAWLPDGYHVLLRADHGQ